MLQARQALVQAKIAALIQQANALYNITLPNIQVRFDLVGLTAGIAGRKHAIYYMRFNTAMMLNDSWQHMIEDTVPHELAHIVCFFKPQLGRAHDTGWKRVCKALGGNGQRCHSEPVLFGRGLTYEYITTAGLAVNIGPAMHANIQAGRGRLMRDGSKINHTCQFSVVGNNGVAVPRTAQIVQYQPVVAVQPQVAVQPVARTMVTAVYTGSKADAVRGRIAVAKAADSGPAVVIQWAVDTLGMTKGLATAYVKNNWAKV